MELEERTLEDNLKRRCEICGVELTETEILAAREAGGGFLCTVHSAEELPAEPEVDGEPADTIER